MADLLRSRFLGSLKQLYAQTVLVYLSLAKYNLVGVQDQTEQLN